MSTHTKYELNWCLPYQVMVITRFALFDLCWPLTLTRNRDRLLTMMNTHTKYELNWSLHYQVTVVTRFLLIEDLCWPQMTFDFDQQEPKGDSLPLYLKSDIYCYGGYNVFSVWQGPCTNYDEHTYQVWAQLKFALPSYGDYTVDLCWPHITFDLDQKQ